MASWTDENREQFKNLLKTIPTEDVAIMTATIWCREFNLKFDDNDEHIARRWHRCFHTGSLETSSGKLYLYVMNEHGCYLPVMSMSTNAASIWTCTNRNNSFMKFNNTMECRKMALSYVKAASERGIKMKLIES